MSFIKNMCTWFVTSMVVALGIETAKTTWENGLGDIVDETTKKLFSKEEGS